MKIRLSDEDGNLKNLYAYNKKAGELFQDFMTVTTPIHSILNETTKMMKCLYKNKQLGLRCLEHQQ